MGGRTGIPGRCLRRHQGNRADEEIIYLQRVQLSAGLAIGLVHDFNNILQSVRLGAETIGRSFRQDERAQEVVASILDAIEIAGSFTRQLMACGRREPSAAIVIGVGRAVSRVRRMLGQSVPDAIEVVPPAVKQLWPVLMEVGRCEQIVLNLLINARDAMPDGGRLKIEAFNRLVTKNVIKRHKFTVEEGEYVVLRVRDSGGRFSGEMTPRIFEPFQTSKASTGGTGLGLAVCRAIVQAAKGAIHAERNKTGGATFTVLLPRHYGHADR